MVRARALVLASVLSACADPPRSADTGAVTTGDPTTNATADASTSDADDGSTASDDAPSSDATSDASSDDGTTVDDTAGDATDTGGTPGPIELYRGPVVGGVLPGWDADAPRPLVLLGRQGEDWIATLAGIDATGALFDNVAEEIVVWGWNDAPPLLYDGPVVGGAIPGWTPADPIPVVMLAQQADDTSWYATLAQIAPDGALDQNLADRIVVWGWPPATANAPSSRYAGPIDAGAVLPGWDPGTPVPLVMLGRLPIGDVWVATLARIAPDGVLSDNLASELRVWGW